MSKNAHSIPTTAMLNAEAAEETETVETPETESFTITFRKKMFKKALITAAIGASLYFAAKAVSAAGMDDTDTEPSED